MAKKQQTPAKRKTIFNPLRDFQGEESDFNPSGNILEPRSLGYSRTRSRVLDPEVNPVAPSTPTAKSAGGIAFTSTGEEVSPSAGERSPPLGGEGSPPLREEKRSPPLGGERSPPLGGERSPPLGGERSPPLGGERSPPLGGERSPPSGGERTFASARKKVFPQARNSTSEVEKETGTLAGSGGGKELEDSFFGKEGLSSNAELFSQKEGRIEGRETLWHV